MAGGMHASALGSGLAPEWKEETEDNALGIEAVHSVDPDSIEVTALSDELSKAAADILKERMAQSKPMNATKFQCRTEQDDEGSHKLRRKDSKADWSPLAKLAFRFLPVFSWAPQLSRKIVQADFIAGVTVGVMVIPQSMSYAAIAGLPYIYGMYSACIPTLIYTFFGQSRQLAVGPVAMVSLLVEAGLRGQLSEEDCPEWYALVDTELSQADVCPEQYASLACLTAATVGVMMIVGSLLKLGFLVSFLGHPVTSGFTSGAAIIIGLSQLKYILGYEIPKSQFVHITVSNILKQIGETQGMPLFLGLLWLFFLMGLKQFTRRYKKFAILGALGPLISCALGIFIVWLAKPLREELHVKYIGDIPSGLMPFIAGSWRFSDVPRVLPTAMSSCLIGYMESIAIGKNLAAKHGYEIDAGQEMLALGLSNLCGSVLSCYPVTGSFSRSAVNNSTGALSQLSGFITSVVMFCTLMFLTPLFYYLPKFALAAIVLNSVLALVAYDEAIKLYKVKKADFLLWIVAFLGTLFLGVLMGIAVAVGLSLIIVIYQSARPQISILWRIPGTTIYRNMKQEGSGTFVPNVFVCRIGSSMYFANAAYVKDMVLTYVSDLEEVNKTRYVVIEMTAVVTIDSTAVHVLEDIVRGLRSREIHTAFCMVGNRVDKTMRRAKLKEVIGEQWFFPTVHDAVLYCLKHKTAKRRRQIEKESSFEGLDIDAIQLQQVNEVGISNDTDPFNTVVFITLTKEVAMIIGEIVTVFKKNRIKIVRAEVCPLDDDEGTKHTYFLKNFRTGQKLTADQIHNIKDDIDKVIKKAHRGESQSMAEFMAATGLEKSSVSFAAVTSALSGRWDSDGVEDGKSPGRASNGNGRADVALGAGTTTRCGGSVCAMQ